MEQVDEYRIAGHRAVEAVAAYLETIADRPVAPSVDRPFMHARYANTVGDTGVGMVPAVEELVEHLFDQSIAMTNPLYLGLVNSSPFPIGSIGDLLVSTIDNNAGAFHQGPTLAATEREVLRAVVEVTGYRGTGLILPGGSYVNFHALQLARSHRFPEWNRDGPSALTALPRIYASDVTHFSVDRAVMALGFGRNSIVSVPSIGRGAINVAELERMIQADSQEGHVPFAVVLTVGTTGTGAVDDVRSAMEVARRHGLWVHVDACYGGALCLLDEWRELFVQVREADSLAVDLHKWFFMPLISGVVLTRHEETIQQSFEIDASYIPDQGHVEAYRKGLPTSRRGSSLAIWLALRAHGWDTIREAVHRNIRLTREIESRLAAAGFRVMDGGELSIACARWEPEAMPPEQWDALQIELSETVRKSGKAWFATTQHAGQVWLRFNMVNLYTQLPDIEELVRVVVASAGKVTDTMSGATGTA